MTSVEEYKQLMERLKSEKQIAESYRADIQSAECEIESIMEELVEPEQAKEEAERGLLETQATIETLEKELKDFKEKNPDCLDNDVEYCKERRKETLSENNLKLDELLVNG